MHRSHILPILAALTFVSLPLASPVVAQDPPLDFAEVVFFGDSITYGFGIPEVDCDDPSTAGGYGNMVALRLAQQGDLILPFTRAVCGELTAEGLTRIDDVLAEGLGDAIVIMEGTNDLSAGTPRISTETVETNLRLMAAKSLAAGVTPVYSGIIPYGPQLNRPERNQRAERLLEDLQTAGEFENLSVADPFHVLFDQRDWEMYYIEDGFHLTEEGYEKIAPAFEEPILAALEPRSCVPGTPCPLDDPEVLCLQDGRFRVEVDWVTDKGSGRGKATALSKDTGHFWFFSETNIELVLKVLDARCLNSQFWVFYGALSNVEYTIRVTDVTTCSQRTYVNPDGTFASAGDSMAFAATVDPEVCGFPDPDAP